eukprot:g2198.t1
MKEVLTYLKSTENSPVSKTQNVLTILESTENSPVSETKTQNVIIKSLTESEKQRRYTRMRYSSVIDMKTLGDKLRKDIVDAKHEDLSNEISSVIDMKSLGDKLRKDIVATKHEDLSNDISSQKVDGEVLFQIVPFPESRRKASQKDVGQGGSSTSYSHSSPATTHGESSRSSMSPGGPTKHEGLSSVVGQSSSLVEPSSLSSNQPKEATSRQQQSAFLRLHCRCTVHSVTLETQHLKEFVHKSPITKSVSQSIPLKFNYAYQIASSSGNVPLPTSTLSNYRDLNSFSIYLQDGLTAAEAGELIIGLDNVQDQIDTIIKHLGYLPIKIKYSTRHPDTKSGLQFLNETTLITSHRGGVGTDSVNGGTFLTGACGIRNWLPCVDTLNSKSTYSITFKINHHQNNLTTNTAFDVLCSGRRDMAKEKYVHETSQQHKGKESNTMFDDIFCFRVGHPIPPYALGFAIGKWKMVTSASGETKRNQTTNTLGSSSKGNNTERTVASTVQFYSMPPPNCSSSSSLPFIDIEDPLEDNNRNGSKKKEKEAINSEECEGTDDDVQNFLYMSGKRWGKQAQLIKEHLSNLFGTTTTSVTGTSERMRVNSGTTNQSIIEKRKNESQNLSSSTPSLLASSCFQNIIILPSSMNPRTRTVNPCSSTTPVAEAYTPSNDSQHVAHDPLGMKSAMLPSETLNNLQQQEISRFIQKCETGLQINDSSEVALEKIAEEEEDVHAGGGQEEEGGGEGMVVEKMTGRKRQRQTVSSPTVLSSKSNASKTFEKTNTSRSSTQNSSSHRGGASNVTSSFASLGELASSFENPFQVQCFNELAIIWVDDTTGFIPRLTFFSLLARAFAFNYIGSLVCIASWKDLWIHHGLLNYACLYALRKVKGEETYHLTVRRLMHRVAEMEDVARRHAEMLTFCTSESTQTSFSHYGDVTGANGLTNASLKQCGGGILGRERIDTKLGIFCGKQDAVENNTAALDTRMREKAHGLLSGHNSLYPNKGEDVMAFLLPDRQALLRVKAPLIFHMLSAKLGDNVFHPVIRDIVTRSHGKTGPTSTTTHGGEATTRKVNGLADPAGSKMGGLTIGGSTGQGGGRIMMSPGRRRVHSTSSTTDPLLDQNKERPSVLTEALTTKSIFKQMLLEWQKKLADFLHPDRIVLLGKELEEFSDQYVFGAGVARLRIKVGYSRIRHKVEVVVEQPQYAFELCGDGLAVDTYHNIDTKSGGREFSGAGSSSGSQKKSGQGSTGDEAARRIAKQRMDRLKMLETYCNRERNRIHLIESRLQNIGKCRATERKRSLVEKALRQVCELKRIQKLKQIRLEEEAQQKRNRIDAEKNNSNNETDLDKQDKKKANELTNDKQLGGSAMMELVESNDDGFDATNSKKTDAKHNSLSQKENGESRTKSVASMGKEIEGEHFDPHTGEKNSIYRRGVTVLEERWYPKDNEMSTTTNGTSKASPDGVDHGYGWGEYDNSSMKAVNDKAISKSQVQGLQSENKDSESIKAFLSDDVQRETTRSRLAAMLCAEDLYTKVRNELHAGALGQVRPLPLFAGEITIFIQEENGELTPHRCRIKGSRRSHFSLSLHAPKQKKPRNAKEGGNKPTAPLDLEDHGILRHTPLNKDGQTRALVSHTEEIHERREAISEIIALDEKEEEIFRERLTHDIQNYGANAALYKRNGEGLLAYIERGLNASLNASSQYGASLISHARARHDQLSQRQNRAVAAVVGTNNKSNGTTKSSTTSEHQEQKAKVSAKEESSSGNGKDQQENQSKTKNGNTDGSGQARKNSDKTDGPTSSLVVVNLSMEEEQELSSELGQTHKDSLQYLNPPHKRKDYWENPIFWIRVDPCNEWLGDIRYEQPENDCWVNLLNEKYYEYARIHAKYGGFSYLSDRASREIAMEDALGGLGDIYAAGQMEVLSNIVALPRSGGLESDLYLSHQKYRERDWKEVENALEDLRETFEQQSQPLIGLGPCRTPFASFSKNVASSVSLLSSHRLRRLLEVRNTSPLCSIPKAIVQFILLPCTTPVMRRAAIGALMVWQNMHAPMTSAIPVSQRKTNNHGDIAATVLKNMTEESHNKYVNYELYRDQIINDISLALGPSSLLAGGKHDLFKSSCVLQEQSDWASLFHAMNHLVNTHAKSSANTHAKSSAKMESQGEEAIHSTAHGNTTTGNSHSTSSKEVISAEVRAWKKWQNVMETFGQCDLQEWIFERVRMTLDVLGVRDQGGPRDEKTDVGSDSNTLSTSDGSQVKQQRNTKTMALRERRKRRKKFRKKKRKLMQSYGMEERMKPSKHMDISTNGYEGLLHDGALEFLSKPSLVYEECLAESEQRSLSALGKAPEFSALIARTGRWPALCLLFALFARTLSPGAPKIDHLSSGKRKRSKTAVPSPLPSSLSFLQKGRYAFVDGVQDDYKGELYDRKALLLAIGDVRAQDGSVPLASIAFVSHIVDIQEKSIEVKKRQHAKNQKSEIDLSFTNWGLLGNAFSTLVKLLVDQIAFLNTQSARRRKLVEELCEQYHNYNVILNQMVDDSGSSIDSSSSSGDIIDLASSAQGGQGRAMQIEGSSTGKHHASLLSPSSDNSAKQKRIEASAMRKICEEMILSNLGLNDDMGYKTLLSSIYLREKVSEKLQHLVVAILHRLHEAERLLESYNDQKRDQGQRRIGRTGSTSRSRDKHKVITSLKHFCIGMKDAICQLEKSLSPGDATRRFEKHHGKGGLLGLNLSPLAMKVLHDLASGKKFPPLRGATFRPRNLDSNAASTPSTTNTATTAEHGTSMTKADSNGNDRLTTAESRKTEKDAEQNKIIPHHSSSSGSHMTINVPPNHPLVRPWRFFGRVTLSGLHKYYPFFKEINGGGFKSIHDIYVHGPLGPVSWQKVFRWQLSFLGKETDVNTNLVASVSNTPGDCLLALWNAVSTARVYGFQKRLRQSLRSTVWSRANAHLLTRLQKSTAGNSRNSYQTPIMSYTEVYADVLNKNLAINPDRETPRITFSVQSCLEKLMSLEMIMMSDNMLCSHRCLAGDHDIDFDTLSHADETASTLAREAALKAGRNNENKMAVDKGTEMTSKPKPKPSSTSNCLTVFDRYHPTHGTSSAEVVMTGIRLIPTSVQLNRRQPLSFNSEIVNDIWEKALITPKTSIDFRTRCIAMDLYRKLCGWYTPDCRKLSVKSKPVAWQMGVEIPQKYWSKITKNTTLAVGQKAQQRKGALNLRGRDMRSIEEERARIMERERERDRREKLRRAERMEATTTTIGTEELLMNSGVQITPSGGAPVTRVGDGGMAQPGGNKFVSFANGANSSGNNNDSNGTSQTTQDQQQQVVPQKRKKKSLADMPMLEEVEKQWKADLEREREMLLERLKKGI